MVHIVKKKLKKTGVAKRTNSRFFVYTKSVLNWVLFVLFVVPLMIDAKSPRLPPGVFCFLKTTSF
jgi:hypothetical protein